ncbi:hypothetical protein GOV11_03840 [Candidatus Woesearchaeota archaeon]|nr:hypothetical protein [Candidatus Woesearchaeota archaeon]
MGMRNLGLAALATMALTGCVREAKPLDYVDEIIFTGIIDGEMINYYSNNHSYNIVEVVRDDGTVRSYGSMLGRSSVSFVFGDFDNEPCSYDFDKRDKEFKEYISKINLEK